MADNYAVLSLTAEEINKILSQINEMKSKDNIAVDTSGDSLELKLQWKTYIILLWKMMFLLL